MKITKTILYAFLSSLVVLLALFNFDVTIVESEHSLNSMFMIVLVLTGLLGVISFILMVNKLRNMKLKTIRSLSANLLYESMYKSILNGFHASFIVLEDVSIRFLYIFSCVIIYLQSFVVCFFL